MPTLGVSIAVPEPWGAQLQDYRVELGDEDARQIPTHITVLPPYDIERDLLDDVCQHLESAASTIVPFNVHLRGTGTFRPISPVVFLNVVEGIAGCEAIAARVLTGVLVPDLRFPYHPHVTIAHDLDESLLDKAFADLADFDASFMATECHLYELDAEAGWIPSQTFTFGG